MVDLQLRGIASHRTIDKGMGDRQRGSKKGGDF